ncbi:EF-hand and coiled-coil domain-containing protein 1-like isoform X1 [Myxocyprinus asiaticus]|uniref:EF-hand and coiled-coil domain-containing protein 1-like isoform X1 n=1 Tax=Myxocyprinus asiaticus TaxID=70543 RepID=UPI002221CB8C|nr:EF-hand and coiled-coil domain-containing protein 1-like isoform X1 [Myxocyprinus asiaticus]XP_051528551.1 EF-hand and coiled-coil domain-containing protein 1-like isoform X1 [Myxocyprinus asiaticus]
MQVSRICAARKSEWLKCALVHHFNPDPGVENEIVVLATGVDQYLQEVFHHLAFNNGDDLVSDEDFRMLCLVLGISISAETENGTTEHKDICFGLPRMLNFKEFHARLCGFFSIKAQEGQATGRLPVSEETELIEREIRLRCPRVRRRKCVSFDLSKDHQTRRRSVRRSGQTQNLDYLKSSVLESMRNSVLDINPQRRWQDQIEFENGSLRELVEDLRSALQSSDARCIALEVALRRKHMPPQHNAVTTQERQDYSVVGKAKTKQPKHVAWDTRRSTKDLQRELELIRSSRDGQLEEAMRFNQRLEEELMAAFGELNRMQEVVGSVRRENARIKKRAEEARGALSAGIEGVRALEDQAQQADLLRDRVQNLEVHLEKFRAQCTCRELNMKTTEILVEPRGSGFPSPTGHDDAIIRREEGLQRSVEGRAASDEEEEERGVDEGQCCLLEVKRLINRLHSCARGCQKTAICQWLVSQTSAHNRELQGSSGMRETKRQVWIPRADEKANKPVKQKEEDHLRPEVQMVETEKRPLLEERLTDALTLLLQLQDKRVSRKVLGKILINTLELCTRKGHESTPVFMVVDTLCQQLISSHLLDGEEVSIGARPPVTPGQRNTSNTHMMSC